MPLTSVASPSLLAATRGEGAATRGEGTVALASVVDHIPMASSDMALSSVTAACIVEAPSVAAEATNMPDAPSIALEVPRMAAVACLEDDPRMAAVACVEDDPCRMVAVVCLEEAPSIAAAACMEEAPSIAAQACMADDYFAAASIADSTAATASAHNTMTSSSAAASRHGLAIAMCTRVNVTSTMADVEITWEGREFPEDQSSIVLSRHVFWLAKQDVTEFNAVLAKRSTAVSHADSVLSSLADKESLRCCIPDDLDRGGIHYSLPLGCAALSCGVGALKQTVCDAVFKVNVVDSRGASVSLGQRAVYTCFVMQEVSAAPVGSPSEQAMLVGNTQCAAGGMMRMSRYVYSKPPVSLQRRDYSPMFEQPDPV